ncbi:MAG: hypothetical protein ATN35_05345 [Epulopiscium sp. Nele67-Bin004]|nr:MAG: hypothetical protein ATN35_05345 [Epulopiscium sp. Nele67-Bin004]
MSLLIFGITMVLILSNIFVWYISILLKKRGYKLNDKFYLVIINGLTLLFSVGLGVYISHIAV